MAADSPRDPPRLHAGFWRRLSAAGVDLVVAYLVSIPLLILAAGFTTPSTAERFLLPAVALYLVAFFGLGSRGATPGKHAFGIVVRAQGGSPVTLPKALLRAVVLVATLGLGLLLAAFTPRKQGLHDLAARTVVVRRGATPQEVREGGGTMRIGPAVALVILVVLSLPFASVFFMGKIREDYVQRARLHEIVIAVKPLQDQVASARASGAAVPAGPVALDARHAKSARIAQDGAILVEVVDRIAPGGRLAFTHEVTPAGAKWSCRAQGIPVSYLGRECPD